LKNIGFIAKDPENDLAAYYGVFPMRMSINGRDYLVAQFRRYNDCAETSKKKVYLLNWQN